MGWLFQQDITRKELIANRTSGWEYQNGETKVTTTCLAHCYRGGAFAGVLWSVFERTFTRDGEEVEPKQRWIACDLLKYYRDSGWGYKDCDESMHPYYYSCPLSYLNMVPIDQYGGEPEWRAQVIKHHELQREKRRSRAIIV